MPMLHQANLAIPTRLPRTILLIVLLTLTSLFLVACDEEDPEQPAAAASRSLTVTGTGRVDAQPDLNLVLFGYWVKDEDANVAIANSQARLAEITAALTTLDIDPADIDAPAATMNSEQIYGPDGYPTERLLYAVNQNVTVTVRDLNRLGDVLNSVRVTAGAPYIYSLAVQPEFSPQRWDQLLAEAQGLALADAQSEAQSLAQQSGLTLGQPLAVSVLSRENATGPLLQAQVTLEVKYALQEAEPPQE